MKVSAGCLVRADFPDGARYLLVHPSGNYNRKAPWSIPKGEFEPDEDPMAAALRELGRLERTLFTLDWIEDPELRRSTGAGDQDEKCRSEH